MSNRSLRLLAVCAALAAPALTSNTNALAQGPAQNADAAALSRSRELFQQANKLYDEGKYPQAEQLYLQAWKLKKSYDVAGNLGNLEADMNKPRAAAEFLSYAIREFPAGGRPTLREALVKRLAEVTKLVGAVRITVNKPAAEVLIDGHAHGMSPLAGEVYVEPGTHNVEVRLEGYPPVSATFNAVKGKTEQVSLSLVPPAGPNKVVLIAGGSVAGAAIVAGAVLMGLGAAKASTVKTLQDEAKAAGGCNGPNDSACQELRDAGASRAALGNAGMGALIAGGAVGVATLVYAFVGGGSPKRTGVRVLPVVTGNGGGLTVGGTF